MAGGLQCFMNLFLLTWEFSGCLTVNTRVIFCVMFNPPPPPFFFFFFFNIRILAYTPYTYLLDRVESKAIRLISDPSLTSTLDPLSLRCKVASLSLFYRYYFGHCSDELAACIPPPMAWPRSTRRATFAHNFYVELSTARINRFSDGFFPSTSHLWNSLPSAVFPASFNLPSFKRQVYHHLRDQMA